MTLRLKGLPRLKAIAGLPPLRRRRPAPPDKIAGEQYFRELGDPQVNEVWARLGRKSQDYKLAKRVAALMETYPDGTIPELVTLDWLEQQKVPYTFQAWVYGGRSRRGGIIPDFVLEYGGRGMAWLIQGDYWHNRTEVAASDQSDKLRLIRTQFHGVVIEVVVELWENKVLRNRPEVFELALVGIGLGE